jgi:hypothetical protein
MLTELLNINVWFGWLHWLRGHTHTWRGPWPSEKFTLPFLSKMTMIFEASLFIPSKQKKYWMQWKVEFSLSFHQFRTESYFPPQGKCEIWVLMQENINQKQWDCADSMKSWWTRHYSCLYSKSTGLRWVTSWVFETATYFSVDSYWDFSCT